MKDTTDEQLKTCSDCGKKKPYDQYTERANPYKTGVRYYTPYCKDCMVKRSVKWRKKNKEKYNEYQRDYARKRYAKEKTTKGKGSV